MSRTSLSGGALAVIKIQKMKQTLLLILTFICATNLTAQNNNQIFDNHWINLTRINNELVIYYPCDAENPQIILDNDKNIMVMKYGIEDETFKILGISDSSNVKKYIRIQYSTFGKLKETSVSVTIIDSVRKIAKWNFVLTDGETNLTNEYIMVPESSSKLFKVKKQPCTDCFSKEDCDKMKKGKK